MQLKKLEATPSNHTSSLIDALKRASAPYAPLGVAPYGILMGLCLTTKSLVAASENAKEILKVSPRMLLGKEVKQYLTEDLKNLISAAQSSPTWPCLLESVRLNSGTEVRYFNVVGQKLRSFLFLSFEEISSSSGPVASAYYEPVEFTHAEAEGHVLERVLNDIQSLTNLESVKLVRFKTASSADVYQIGPDSSLLKTDFESKDFNTVKSRALFTYKNSSHHLDNSGADEQVRIFATLEAQRGLLKELTPPIQAKLAIKGSSDPEKVMATGTQFVIPMKHSNTLWGMVICEDSARKHVSFKARMHACAYAQYLTSLLLLSFRDSFSESADAGDYHLTPLRTLLISTRHLEFETIAFQIQLPICEALGLDGIVFVNDNFSLTFGKCPSRTVVAEIQAKHQYNDTILQTNNIADWQIVSAQQGSDTMGVIYIPCMSQHNFAIIGFRERKRVLRRSDDHANSIFRVSNRATPWSTENLVCARKIRELAIQYLIRPTVISKH